MTFTTFLYSSNSLLFTLLLLPFLHLLLYPPLLDPSSHLFFSGTIIFRASHILIIQYLFSPVPGVFSVNWKKASLPLCVKQISFHKNIHFTGRCPIQTNIHVGKGFKHYSPLYSNWKQRNGAVPEISASCCTWFVLVMRMQSQLSIHSLSGLIIGLKRLWPNNMCKRHISHVLLCRTDVVWAPCHRLMMDVPNPTGTTVECEALMEES